MVNNVIGNSMGNYSGFKFYGNSGSVIGKASGNATPSKVDVVFIYDNNGNPTGYFFYAKHTKVVDGIKSNNSNYSKADGVNNATPAVTPPTKEATGTPLMKRGAFGLAGVGIGMVIAHFAKQNLWAGAGIGLVAGVGASFINNNAKPI